MAVQDNGNPARGVALPAAVMGPQSDDDTTAAGDRFFLAANRANWISVRDWNGADWVYFGAITAFRSGLTEVRSGFNGTAAQQVLSLEPCHFGTARLNASSDQEQFMPAVRASQGFVNSVAVTIIYDDGTLDQQVYQRQDVLEPS